MLFVSCGFIFLNSTVTACYPRQTEANVAAVINTMLPAAYAEELNLGLCYFEFCDEWWNQSGYDIAAQASCSGATGPNAPNGGSGGSSFTMPKVHTWYDGPIACGH